MTSSSNTASNADIATARRVLSMEAEALNLMANSLDDRFVQAVETCLGATGRVIVSGVGKSGHVARKIAATLASTGTPSIFVHPTEASHGDLGMIAKGDVVIAMSRSGETSELSDIIHYTRRFQIPLISICAKAESTLAKAADISLLIPDGPEACSLTSAPTTSTTLTIALGDALAVALLERKGFKAEDFRVFHPGGKLGAMLKTVTDLMHTGDELPLVQSGATLSEALNILSQKGWGCVGITDANGAFIGMLTDGDVRRLVTSGKTVSTVDEAMTRSPITANTKTLASTLLNTLNEKRFTQMFILEDNKPVGVIHMHDLLKAGVS